MGYKVKTPGRVPEEYTFTCPACGCVFTASGSALSFNHTTLGYPEEVKTNPEALCPYCRFECEGEEV